MSAPLEISSRLLSSRLVTAPVSVRELTRYEGLASADPLERAVLVASAGRLPRYPDGYGRHGENARQNRVYDRARSRQRKRMMGGDGRLPNTIRHWFTEGERAVLSVIADEVKRRGKCELPVEKIAAKAGVSIRLVQYAIATASNGSKEILDRKRKGEPVPPLLISVERRPRKGARSLPNLIKIVSREWMSWLSYQPSEAPAVEAAEEGEWSAVDVHAGQLGRVLRIGCKKKHTSENPYLSTVVEEPITDNWQRQRMGLPVQRGSGGGARARGRPDTIPGGRGNG